MYNEFFLLKSHDIKSPFNKKNFMFGMNENLENYYCVPEPEFYMNSNEIIFSYC